jgi:hypothetical protein
MYRRNFYGKIVPVDKPLFTTGEDYKEYFLDSDKLSDSGTILSKEEMDVMVEKKSEQMQKERYNEKLLIELYLQSLNWFDQFYVDLLEFLTKLSDLMS